MASSIRVMIGMTSHGIGPMVELLWKRVKKILCHNVVALFYVEAIVNHIGLDILDLLPFLLKCILKLLSGNVQKILQV